MYKYSNLLSLSVIVFLGIFSFASLHDPTHHFAEPPGAKRPQENHGAAAQLKPQPVMVQQPRNVAHNHGRAAGPRSRCRHDRQGFTHEVGVEGNGGKAHGHRQHPNAQEGEQEPHGAVFERFARRLAPAPHHGERQRQERVGALDSAKP